MKSIILLFIMALIIRLIKDSTKQSKRGKPNFKNLLKKQLDRKDGDSRNLKPKKRFYFGKDWKKKKGDDYEFYIKKFYENEGYRVVPTGYIKGLEDEGVDLVAHNDIGKETILIQCKNWKNGAELKDIVKFYNDCKKYQKKYSHFFKGRSIRKVFVISNEIQNLEIENFLKQINNEIEFFNVPIF